MRRAVYAGSFDPITNGHVWVIEKGAQLFDQLYIAVGNNPSKKATFTSEQRKYAIESVTLDKTNIYVTEFTDFLIDFVKIINFKYILRGIRNPADFEYEKTMSNLHSKESFGDPEITTVFLTPPSDLIDISSSLVKSISGPVGWEPRVSQMVPEASLHLLQEMVNARQSAT